MSKKKTPEEKLRSNPVGKPTDMTLTALTKLAEAFSKGMNDIQACNFAGITRRVLNYYEDKHPEYREQKEVLRASPGIRAVLNIYDSLADGDIDTSKWYAERKMKDEFSTKQEIDNRIDISQTPTEELLRLAEEAMAKLKESKE